MALLLLVLGILAASVIFFSGTLPVKIFAFSMTALALVLQFSNTEHRTEGLFTRSGWVADGSMALTGVGHYPTRIELEISMDGEVVASNLRLRHEGDSVESMVDGKRLGFRLLSLMKDGFVLHVINKTGLTIEARYRSEGNKLAYWASFFRRS